MFIIYGAYFMLLITSYCYIIVQFIRRHVSTTTGKRKSET